MLHGIFFLVLAGLLSSPFFAASWWLFFLLIGLVLHCFVFFFFFRGRNIRLSAVIVGSAMFFFIFAFWFLFFTPQMSILPLACGFALLETLWFHAGEKIFQGGTALRSNLKEDVGWFVPVVFFVAADVLFNMRVLFAFPILWYALFFGIVSYSCIRLFLWVYFLPGQVSEGVFWVSLFSIWQWLYILGLLPFLSVTKSVLAGTFFVGLCFWLRQTKGKETPWRMVLPSITLVAGVIIVVAITSRWR